jgi:hypothetical protein
VSGEGVHNHHLGQHLSGLPHNSQTFGAVTKPSAGSIGGSK